MMRMGTYRLTKDKYYLNIAKAASLRSTCLRRMYGAVIVKDDVVRATGYNGSPRGKFNCCDLKQCNREGIPQWERYDLCCATHAEINAIYSVRRDLIFGGKLYLFGYDLVTGTVIKDAKPCEDCQKIIDNCELEVINYAKLIGRDKG